MSSAIGKAVTGAALIGGAVALEVMTAGAATPFEIAAMHVGLSMGISLEAGAIAQALTQNRGMNITTRQPASFRQIIYGVQRVGGVVVYRATSSNHNHYIYIIVLATHECYAIENLYLDGRQVYWTQGSTGNTTRNGYNFGGVADNHSHTGPDGQSYNFGDDVSVYCVAQYGDQSAVDLQSYGFDLGAFTANSQGIPYLGGCTYVYLNVGFNSSVFPGEPEIRFTIHGKCDILDPRTGTRGFSTNSSLCVNDVISDATWGIGDSSFNEEQLIVAANVCDEMVALAAGGTEARYSLNWHYETSMPPGDVISAMLGSCAGRLTRVGGEWFIWPAYWQGPSFAWDENALLGAVQWSPVRKMSDLCNRVSGTYIAPNYPYNVAGNLYDTNGWYNGTVQNNFPYAFQPTSFPMYACDPLHGYAADAYLAADGRQLPHDLNLQTVLSVSQSQRLAKIYLLRNRQQGSGKLMMCLAAFQMMPIDVMELNFPQFGWVGKVLEIGGMNLRLIDNGQSGRAIYVEVDIQETGPSVYEWSVTEELSVYDVPVSTLAAPAIPDAPSSVTLTSSAATAVLALDGTLTPRVQVTWGTPQDVRVTQIQVQYRLHSAAAWLDTPLVDVGNTMTFVSGVVAGTVHDFRVRSVCPSGVMSIWVELDSYTVSVTYSSIGSKGLQPGIPYNLWNDAVIAVTGSFNYAGHPQVNVAIYGPGGVGTNWDNYSGFGSSSYPPFYITGSSSWGGGLPLPTSGSKTYYFVYDVVNNVYQVFTQYQSALLDQYLMVGALSFTASSGSAGTQLPPRTIPQ